MTNGKGKTGEKTNYKSLAGEPTPASQPCDFIIFLQTLLLSHTEWTKSINQLPLKVYLQYTYLSDIKHKL